MNAWLLKTEPSEYSLDDLQSDGRTLWDGVANAMALKFLRQISAGDQLLIYHTGSEKAVVGIATATADAVTRSSDPGDVAVEIQFDRRLPRPVSLAEMKADKAFHGWELLRLPRLSVMPVPAPILAAIKKLGAGSAR